LGDSSEPVALRYARDATHRIIGATSQDRGIEVKR
jgi:hypothetical protein